MNFLFWRRVRPIRVRCPWCGPSCSGATINILHVFRLSWRTNRGQIISKINQYRINPVTYLPIVRIIGTIFIPCNRLNPPSLEGSDLRMTSHMTCIPPNINNHEMEHTWVIWSRFSGDMTNETWSGWRICEIAIARVFPEPVPDIIVESKPASSVRAACSWSCLGTMVFSLSMNTIKHALKTFALAVGDSVCMNSADGMRLPGISSETGICSCSSGAWRIACITVWIWGFHGSIIGQGMSRQRDATADNSKQIE